MVNLNDYYATRGGEKFLIKLIAIVLIGKCLLLFADESDLVVYVKLAVGLVFITTIFEFLKL